MQIDYVEFCGALSALIAAIHAEQEAAAERLQRLAEQVRKKTPGFSLPPSEGDARNAHRRRAPSWGSGVGLSD